MEIGVRCGIEEYILPATTKKQEEARKDSSLEFSEKE
jgi:hypothetical protein